MPQQVLNALSGQLPIALGDLYLGVQGVNQITSVILTNTDTVARTVNLLVKRSTDTVGRNVLPKSMSLDPNASVSFETPLTLISGDLLQGFASVASKIDYTINGYLE